MRDRDLEALEFPRVLEQLAAFARSPAGKKACLELRPHVQLREADAALTVTKELAELSAAHGDLPIGEFPDIRAVLLLAARPGATLDGASLLTVRQVLDVAEDTRRFLRQHGRPYPALHPWLERIAPLLELRATLHRALDEHGQVSDDASDELAQVRREIRHLRSRLERRLQALLYEPHMQEVLADHFVTIRHNRYVIPVRSSYAARFEGVVQDRSASGETAFIEPLFAVEANNRLMMAAKEEERLVQRILADLTEMVHSEQPALVATFEALTELDRLSALVRYGRSYQGTVPKLGAEEIRLPGARHPLLLAQQRTVVPVDLMLPQGKSILVITGPNTGGKTVALKTLGLLALMAQSGFLLPAAEGSQLPLFSGVFADIGDEQSLARNLSTFSAHIANLTEIFRSVTPPALVLLDEPGVGTDPEEGAALAIGLLRTLNRPGIRLVATSHYSPVKLFALAEEACLAAAVDFDVESLEPRYHLVYHSIGESLAFPIAARLGLPSEVLEAAAQARSRQGRELAEALARLESARRAYEEKFAATEEARARAEEARREAERLTADLREKKRRQWATELQEAREFLRGLRERGEELLEQVRRGEADRAALRRFLREEHEAVELAGRQWPPPAIAREAAVGDWVEVVGQGVRGRLAKISGERAWIERGSMRFEVPRDRLRAVAGGETQPRTREPETTPAAPVEELREISLLGFRTREAIERLDQFLDAATRAGVVRVRVIHGIGSGALKRAVSEYLEQSPYCVKFRAGESGEGGAGVTIVDLEETT
ncbi:MAG: endonuclease MutS2 [Candidatus Binatia bacterium]|nr:endonuclease MutS2 [Candidatus Binatia bacterium]